MSSLKLMADAERLEFGAVSPAAFVFEHQDAITLEGDVLRGRGEACGVFYLNDTRL